MVTFQTMRLSPECRPRLLDTANDHLYCIFCYEWTIAMRIGLMLRAYSEKGGVGVYTRNIAKHLVESDQDNEYFLYYANKEFIGSFADCSNVTERVVNIGSKVVWDQ